MWFLLLQISVLLLLAAVFGAWLAWLWMKRRYEDVTETHEKLLSEATRFERLTQLASRDEVKQGFTSLNTAVADLKPTDITPALERLQRIEHFLAGLKMPDLQPVQDRLSERLIERLAPIERRLGPIEQRLAAINLEPVTNKVAELTTLVGRQPPPDMKPVEDRINALEQTIRSIRIPAPPAPDLGPVHSGIATLQLAFDKATQQAALAASQPKGLDAIEDLLGGLETKLLALGGLERKITELGEQLESTRRNDHDMTSNRLATITSSVGALRNADLQPIAGRIEAVEQGVALRLSAVEEGLVQRLGAVEQAIADFQAPAPDFRPLHASMIDLERAVMALDKPQVDLGPLHNRLAALQASLAGVQAEMRNRHALEAVERRIASLQEAVQGIPEPDFAPVIGAVHSIDARLDLGALENRLTAIEYGLAAVHHSLRSRPEPVATRNETTWQSGQPAQPSWQQRSPGGSVASRQRMPAPPRPPRESDPINTVRRADDQANLLTDPAFGPPDDLEQIHGVGPMLRELLNDIGVYYYWQIAEWTPDEVAFVDSRLMHFRGRIRRDDWIEHARTLAAAPSSARRPAGY